MLVLSTLRSLPSVLYDALFRTSYHRRGFIPSLCGEEHLGTPNLEIFFDVALEAYLVDHAESHQCWISKIQYCALSRRPTHHFVLLHVNRERESCPFGYIFVDGDREDMPLAEVSSLFRLRSPGCSRAVRDIHPRFGYHGELTDPRDLFPDFFPPLQNSLYNSNSSDSSLDSLARGASSDGKPRKSRIGSPRAVLLSNVNTSRLERREYNVLSEVVCDEGAILLTHFIAAGRVAAQAATRPKPSGALLSAYFPLVFGHLLSDGELLDGLDSFDKGNPGGTRSVRLAAVQAAAESLRPSFAEHVKRVASLQSSSARGCSANRSESEGMARQLMEESLAKERRKRQEAEEQLRILKQKFASSTKVNMNVFSSRSFSRHGAKYVHCVACTAVVRMMLWVWKTHWSLVHRPCRFLPALVSYHLVVVFGFCSLKMIC